MLFGLFFNVVACNVEQFLDLLNLLEVLILWKMKNDVCGEKNLSGAHFLQINNTFFTFFKTGKHYGKKMKIFITYRDMP